jgi:Phage integrase family
MNFNTLGRFLAILTTFSVTAVVAEQTPVSGFWHETVPVLAQRGDVFSSNSSRSPRNHDTFNVNTAANPLWDCRHAVGNAVQAPWIIESLKKRRRNVYRAVPVPGTLIDQLDMVHGIREAQKRRKDDILEARLWPIARNTAWRHVTAVMKAAGILEGPHRCPKGLRHGYAIHALSKNVPLNMVSKWMGHSQMETTAIYANAVGEEQQSIAARMWTQ